MSYSHRLGTTLLGLTKLDALATPVIFPKSTPPGFEETEISVSGVSVGFGLSCTWQWVFLTMAMRNYLKSTFCSNGLSNDIFLTTLTASGQYLDYSGIIRWPKPPEKRSSIIVQDFVISFTDLVYIPPPAP
jgi:hypothetical protein